MVVQNSVTAPTTSERSSSALEELHGRIARRFSRSDARERARQRANGWQFAGHLPGDACVSVPACYGN